jgi:hypothetical protein
MDEEPWLDQVMHAVQDDSFHDFAILELQLHPDAVNHGRIREELQIVSVALALKTLDEKYGLDAAERDFAKGIVFRAAQPENLGKPSRTLHQQAFQFFPLLRLNISLANATAGMNDNLVELYLIARPGSEPMRRYFPAVAGYRIA